MSLVSPVIVSSSAQWMPCCDPVSTGWTVSLSKSSHFYAGYSYRCDHGCNFRKESRTCYKHIQCRPKCDSFSIPNGQANCDSIFEGQTCYVSCNRLFKLQGSSHIRCMSSGWSSYPYCIGKYRCSVGWVIIITTWKIILNIVNLPEVSFPKYSS